jgi:hypothetical protein
LVVDVLPILQQYGNSTVEQIRRNLAATGTNATGKTSRSLKYEVRVEANAITLKVIGRPFFNVVETGRKATPQYDKPSPEFVASIQEWAKAKGVPGAAYAIAKSIHQKGTKLFQSGGRTDVYSSVVNQSLVDKISQDVLDKFAKEYLKNAVNIFTGGNNAN